MIEVVEENYDILNIKKITMACFCRDCKQYRGKKLKTVYIQTLFRNSLVNSYTKLGINKIFDDYNFTNIS